MLRNHRNRAQDCEKPLFLRFPYPSKLRPDDKCFACFPRWRVIRDMLEDILRVEKIFSFLVVISHSDPFVIDLV